MNIPPRTTLVRAAAGLGATAALPAWLLAGLPGGPAAGADGTEPFPAFTRPTEITNSWFPLQPGGLKVYTGREGRARTVIVEEYLTATRTFRWPGGETECRILRESKFSAGKLVETSWSYFAQADDGSVWIFGDIGRTALTEPSPDPEDEPGDQESSGWVVGARAETDPEDTVSASVPALFMPADPRPGDVWKPEDLAPVADETDTAVRILRRLRVPGGRFENCLEVEETSILPGPRETKWYAQGVGVVKGKSAGESFRLQASNLVAE